MGRTMTGKQLITLYVAVLVAFAGPSVAQTAQSDDVVRPVGRAPTQTVVSAVAPEEGEDETERREDGSDAGLQDWLVEFRSRALANGVDDMQLLNAGEAAAMEPQLHCLAALHSPSTGIIDSHALMLSLLGEGERHGAMLATRSPVTGITRDSASGIFTVNVGGETAMSLTTLRVINAAGHGACTLAAPLLAAGSQPAVTPVLSKGNYFRLSGKAPFSRLVYPVPEAGGLGVHITIDLGGQARFGPDVEPISEENYIVDPSRSADFYAAVRSYWPGLPDDSLAPDYAGIRPKIRVGGALYPDFLIQSQSEHGLPGLINLFGIESPGLTACLAIASEVNRLLPH